MKAHVLKLVKRSLKVEVGDIQSHESGGVEKEFGSGEVSGWYAHVAVVGYTIAANG